MDDLAAKAVISLYEKHASAFEKMRLTNLSEKPWLERFITHIAPGGNILDIGCGNGHRLQSICLVRGSV